MYARSARVGLAVINPSHFFHDTQSNAAGPLAAPMASPAAKCNGRVALHDMPAQYLSFGWKDGAQRHRSNHGWGEKIRPVHLGNQLVHWTQPSALPWGPLTPQSGKRARWLGQAFIYAPVFSVSCSKALPLRLRKDGPAHLPAPRSAHAGGPVPHNFPHLSSTSRAIRRGSIAAKLGVCTNALRSRPSPARTPPLAKKP